MNEKYLEKIDQLDNLIRFHRKQIVKLNFTKRYFDKKLMIERYNNLYWSVLSKYFKIIKENEDVILVKVIYEPLYNPYLCRFVLERINYNKIPCMVVFDADENREYCKTDLYIEHFKNREEITEQEFYKYNFKYKTFN